MSVLYNMRVSIESTIKSSGVDAAKMAGKIGLRTGRILQLITPDTPDDPEVVAKLRQAAKALLSINL